MTVSLLAGNLPHYYIRHRDFRARVDAEDSSLLFIQDATFEERRGLADNTLVSFESVNAPGRFLRHRNFEVWLDINDDSEAFRNDASFHVRPGLADPLLVSYEARNFPGHYVRHQNFELFLHENDGSELFRRDATFRRHRPLTAQVGRLEPLNSSDDITAEAQARAALQARLHDPLWMIARQWQFGELQADNGGSPIAIHVEGSCSRLSRYAPSTASMAYDPKRMPLETLVEGESPVEEERSVGKLIEAGLQFLRFLQAFGASAVQQRYRDFYHWPTPTESERREWDLATRRTVALLVRGVPDTRRLHKDLSQALGVEGDRAGSLPAEPTIPAEQGENVIRAARAWLKWYVRQGVTVPQTESCWRAERMEYAFSVGTRLDESQVTLTAPEYADGHLDWFSFHLNPQKSLDAKGSTQKLEETVLPHAISYRGMPASRLWEFEDGLVNLARLETDTSDVARQLLVEFALIYGNDWFVVPIELDVGSVCRIHTVTVRDTFGQHTRLRHYSAVDGKDSRWSMFNLSEIGDEGNRPSPDVLFLPPVLARSLEGPPIEEVRFIRDEMANMVWGVERMVESPAGEPLDRYEQFQEYRRHQEVTGDAVARPPSSLGLVYRLGTEVPDYWIPFVPEPGERMDPRTLRLRRAALPRMGPEGPTAIIKPLGTLLEPERDLRLYGEEVPREGARVTRAYQYARWIDGTGHLWIGRRKRPGKGEGSSGLQFDVLVAQPEGGSAHGHLPGLLALWKLDGDARDAVGGNHGELVPDSRGNFGPGKVGLALTQGIVRIPHTPVLEIAEEFTVSFWFSPQSTIDSSIPRTHTFFLKGANTINTANGNGCIEVRGPDPRPLSTTRVWDAGEWYHIVVTCSSKGYQVYVNGSQEGSSPSTHSILANEDDIQLGEFDSLDEVTIYNRALSTEEIHVLYSNQSELK